MEKQTIGVLIMRKTIWKFPLEITDSQIIELPSDYNIIGVYNQKEKLVLYLEVDPDSPKKDYLFEIFGTGHPIPEIKGYRTFIGTCLFNDGDLVFHVYSVYKI